MHIIFNEDHYLDNTSIPVDLNQEPADLVILSFSDSDLNAFANALPMPLAPPVTTTFLPDISISFN